MTIMDKDTRMRCIEQAVVMSGRLQQNTAKSVIAIADELCQYVLIGSSPTVAASGEAIISNPPSETMKKSATTKSG